MSALSYYVTLSSSTLAPVVWGLCSMSTLVFSGLCFRMGNGKVSTYGAGCTISDIPVHGLDINLHPLLACGLSALVC